MFASILRCHLYFKSKFHFFTSLEVLTSIRTIKYPSSISSVVNSHKFQNNSAHETENKREPCSFLEFEFFFLFKWVYSLKKIDLKLNGPRNIEVGVGPSKNAVRVQIAITLRILVYFRMKEIIIDHQDGAIIFSSNLVSLYYFNEP